MTPLWPTNDTRRQPWQTFAPPLHIWPPLLSQTTLVKQDDQGSENQDLCPRKRGAFSFITQTFAAESWHWFLTAFLSSGPEKARENANVFPPLALFSFVTVLPLSVRREREIDLCDIFGALHPWNKYFWLWIFRKEGEIDLFDIFLGAPPGILPSQPLSMYISILARWTYNLSVWVILHKYQPRSYCYLHIPTSHFSLLFKFQVCYFQIFLWLNLIIEDFSEELTLNSRVYIRTNISGENILNWFTNQFPYKGNFSLFQIFSSALTERLQMRRRRISDEWPNIQTRLANTVNRRQYLSPRKRMWVVDKYRANNNSHNLHYLCTTEWRGGRQNNHRWTLLPWIHIRRANNVTLTINAKENTLNTTVSILAIFYLCSGIYSQPQFVITFP